MAKKRMFTLEVIDTDAFLEMPLSAQALYFHLNMRADDDGFVANPKKINKLIGASEDDMKILLAKRYVLAFETGIIVIKHWRMHNTIRMDRYKPTNYQEELSCLSVKDNGNYTLDTKWQPNGNQMETQYRLDKNSNNNVSSEADTEEIDKNFEIIYSRYPKKGTKASAKESYKKWIQKSGRKVGGKTYHLDNKQIWAAVDNYVKQMESKNTDLEYYKNFSTLMNQLLDWVVEDGD